MVKEKERIRGGEKEKWGRKKKDLGEEKKRSGGGKGKN